MPGSHTWLRTVRAAAVTTPPQTSAQMLGLINAQTIVTVVPMITLPSSTSHQSFEVQASVLREKGCREETIEEGRDGCHANERRQDRLLIEGCVRFGAGRRDQVQEHPTNDVDRPNSVDEVRVVTLVLDDRLTDADVREEVETGDEGVDQGDEAEVLFEQQPGENEAREQADDASASHAQDRPNGAGRRFALEMAVVRGWGYWGLAHRDVSARSIIPHALTPQHGHLRAKSRVSIR